MIILLETLEAIVSFSLLGLIWTIQVVHYPSFHFIDSKKFINFEKFHSKSISLIVMPLMLIEIIVASLLVLYRGNNFDWTFLAIVLLIWLSTFVLSVPIHNKLSFGKDSELIRKLVITNWPRTILWTLKVIILLIGRS